MHPRTEELLQHLATNRDLLRAALDETPHDLRECKPTPERWSVAEVLQHLAIVERQVATMLLRGLRTAQPLPPDHDHAPVLPTLDANLLLDRERRLQAGPSAQPAEAMPADEAWRALESTRNSLTDVLLAADGQATNTVRAPHPFLGELTFHQWFAFIGFHEARHAAQIRATVAELGYRSSAEGAGADNGEAPGTINLSPDRLVDIILSLDQVTEELSESATPEQIAEALSRVSDDEVSSAFQKRAQQVADSFLGKAARSTGPDVEEDGFLSRHRGRWRDSLLIAKTFLDYSVGLGHDINTAERPRAVETQNAKFEALIRNHARICRIGKETLCLAANGYSAGALARWRTMHEIAVVCLFLRQHDEELSRRYLLYDAIDSQKSAKAHDEHAHVLMCVRPTEEELEAVNEARRVLVDAYGKEFAKDYGWAHGYVTGQPTFDAIQNAVDLRHWQPPYKLACQEIHAAAKPLYFNLSAGLQRDFLLVGPSSEGLAEVLHPVLLSTNMVTACLVAEFPSSATTFCTLVLHAIANRAGEALIRESGALSRTSDSL